MTWIIVLSFSTSPRSPPPLLTRPSSLSQSISLMLFITSPFLSWHRLYSSLVPFWRRPSFFHRVSKAAWVGVGSCGWRWCHGVTPETREDAVHVVSPWNGMVAIDDRGASRTEEESNGNNTPSWSWCFSLCVSLLASVSWLLQVRTRRLLFFSFVYLQFGRFISPSRESCPEGVSSQQATAWKHHHSTGLDFPSFLFFIKVGSKWLNMS